MRKTLAVAVAISLGAHLLAYGGGQRFAGVRSYGAPAEAAPTPATAEVPDRWTGDTAELPGAPAAGALYDVAIEPPPAAAPVPVAASRAAPIAVAPVLVDPAASADKAPKTVPSASPTASASTSAPASASAPASPRPRPRASASASASTSAETSQAEAPRSRARARSAGEASPGGGGGTFGAEGPASVRDLGRAFTRAIPPANDTDPVWASAPPGDAGKLEVAVHVDESGHITGAEPRGKVQPATLVSLVRRTVPMLQAGTFAVRDGAVTEGVEILEVHATVSDGASDDEPANGGRLAFEYARGRGKASFTRAGGRRVDVTVRVLRVDVAKP